MNVLSCFDGMSCGQIAFERAGIPVKKYYASEIDKYAIQVTMVNYPDTIQLGSITEWQNWNIETPDIIIGGSPCQGFSFAGKGLNFEDERSKLFFTFVEILKHYKPKYFLLENVIMKKEHNDVISSILGEIYPECVTQTELFRTGRIEPIEINSALVSAQNRRRLYWTNIPGITQPKDKGILLRDIIENATTEKEKSYCLDANYFKGSSVENYQDKSKRQLVKCGAFRGRESELKTQQMLEIRDDEKTNSLTSVSKDNLCVHILSEKALARIDRKNGYKPRIMPNKTGTLNTKNNSGQLSIDNGTTLIPMPDNLTWRKLTPIECERLQTVPDNYTNHVSNSQRYKMLGNGWTVDVISHIFKHLI